MTTLLYLIAAIFLIAVVLIALALICAASFLKCKRCQGWHDGECENVDWREQ